MRTEEEIVSDIKTLEEESKVGREILREWNKSELYSGQFLKQRKFFKEATERGLLPLAEDA